MNGKFKSCVSVFLLSVFISISSVFPVFADDFVTTPIPDYVESTVNSETAEEVAVLGTIAQLITDGTTFDFSNFNGSYSDFIDSIYNLSPLYLWDYGFNQVNNLITEIDNQVPVLRWLDNMFGFGPFETISGVVNEKYKGVFNRFNQDNEEVPSPPSDYTSYIQLINGDSGSGYEDFWWRDFQQYYPYGGNTPQYLNYPLYTKSYRFRSGNGTSASNRPIRCYDLTSIYIIWNESIQKYETTITTQSCPNFLSIGYNTNESTRVYSSDSTSFYNGDTVIYGNYYNSTTVESYSVRYEHSTITGILTKIASNWRNVNIYVNGVPWAIVGDTSSYYYVDPNGLKYQDTEINVKVDYPDNTYFDYNILKQIIQKPIFLLKKWNILSSKTIAQQN